MKRSRSILALLLCLCMTVSAVAMLCLGSRAAEETAYLDEALVITSRSLNLQSYLGVDYTVMHGASSVLRNNYDSFYIGLRLGEGEEERLPAIYSGSSYSAFEKKTTATQMTETMTATLYAVSKADGKTYHGPANSASVRDGVLVLLRKETNP